MRLYYAYFRNKIFIASLKKIGWQKKANYGHSKVFRKFGKKHG